MAYTHGLRIDHAERRSVQPQVYFETRRDCAILCDILVCDIGLNPLSLTKEEWQKSVVQSTIDRETVCIEK